MTNIDLWIKVVHLLALISWMSAMLYLPRLFVYHAEAGPGSAAGETFKVMERRLVRAIMTPAMIVTWAAGLFLAWHIYDFQGGWLHAKIALVVAMSGLHGYFAASRKKFAADRNTKSPRFWRIMNEAPAAILVVIVVLVVVQPF